MCKSLLHMVASECGCKVLKYLCQYGCISNLEVIKNLGLKRQIVVHHLQALEDLGLLRVYTTVENEARLPAQYRSAKIRGWIGLPPEYSQRAIQRYLAFFEKESPAKIGQYLLGREAENARARMQAKEASRLFEEYMKDKTPPIRHKDFRNWLQNVKDLDFNVAKSYADMLFSLGRLSL